ncbi:fatty acid desaturase [Labrys miyagiensis]|uniref:Fatty acid desaturase n=1 Tax=Labrys miyagiensis TaxID=346912 RepID=A0ABQ6CHJ9_9HYPH|nr:fatty acid desaturase family protein [Labrys miyagiensis]GLS19640.1 fatty acid desaturase [Labrys miyagiensis]
MDHRDIIASLAAEQRGRLLEKSDRAGLAQLALHGGAIGVLGVLIALKIPFWPLLMLPQGILVIFLFTMLHETVHETAFDTPWLNRVAAATAGFLILVPPSWFRYFHFAHHRFTQDPANDPELQSPKPETMWEYMVHVSGIPTWWGEIRQVCINAAGRCRDTFVPAKGQAKVRKEARLMLVGYATAAGSSIYFGSPLLLYIWLFPIVLGQPFLRLYLLAEHGRCPYVANMLENSRTTLSNWLVRKIAWNMPFHAEHHAYPGVPFHRLPEFHAITKAHVTETERSYSRFHTRYWLHLRRRHGR